MGKPSAVTEVIAKLGMPRLAEALHPGDPARQLAAAKKLAGLPD
jgi:hypothetical protein